MAGLKKKINILLLLENKTGLAAAPTQNNWLEGALVLVCRPAGGQYQRAFQPVGARLIGCASGRNGQTCPRFPTRLATTAQVRRAATRSSEFFPLVVGKRLGQLAWCRPTCLGDRCARRS